MSYHLKMDGESQAAQMSITKQDLMALGLSGGANAAENRQKLMKKLNLPSHMSANALLQALNLLCDLDELRKLMADL